MITNPTFIRTSRVIKLNSITLKKSFVFHHPFLQESTHSPVFAAVLILLIFDVILSFYFLLTLPRRQARSLLFTKTLAAFSSCFIALSNGFIAFIYSLSYSNFGASSTSAPLPAPFLPKIFSSNSDTARRADLLES